MIECGKTTIWGWFRAFTLLPDKTQNKKRNKTFLIVYNKNMFK